MIKCGGRGANFIVCPRRKIFWLRLWSICTAARQLELPRSTVHKVKDIVYRTKVRDITDLRQRISNAIATIDEAMLQQTWQEIEYRLDVLRATNGAHIEVY